MNKFFIAFLCLIAIGCSDDEAQPQPEEVSKQEVQEFLQMQQYFNTYLGTLTSAAATQMAAATSCPIPCPEQSKPTSGFCQQEFANDYFLYDFNSCNLDNGTNAGQGTDCNGTYVDGELCIRSYAPNGQINTSGPPVMGDRNDVRIDFNGVFRIGNCEILPAGGFPQIYFYNISGPNADPYLLRFYRGGFTYFKLTGYDDNGNVISRLDFVPPSSANTADPDNDGFPFMTFVMDVGGSPSTTVDYADFLANTDIGVIFESGTNGSAAAGDLWTVFRRDASDVRETQPFFFFEKTVNSSGGSFPGNENPLDFTFGDCQYPFSGKVNIISPSNTNVVSNVVDFDYPVPGGCDNQAGFYDNNGQFLYALTID